MMEREEEGGRRKEETLLERAKALRREQTRFEAELWQQLRAKRFGAFKFRRQQPIGPYIVDFICFHSHLIVELDGGQHLAPDALAHDGQRSMVLTKEGFEVLRFWNHEVLQQTDVVLQQIANVAQRRAVTLTPALSRAREREQDSKDNMP